jgi:hypothetical protein
MKTSRWIRRGGGQRAHKIAVSFSRLAKLLLLSASAASPSLAAQEQNDAYWDAEFGVPGANQGLLVLATGIDGKLYAGGWFTDLANRNCNHVAVWDGDRWENLGEGIGDPPADTSVWALGFFRGAPYAGGFFQGARTTPANLLARWDGRAWRWVEGAVGGGVLALAEYRGQLYVGGSFGRNGQAPGLNLARWDGERWHGVGGGVSRLEVQPGPFPITNEIGNVQALLATDHGLYVGGQFDQAGVIEAHSIARWDGTNWSNLGLGLKRNIQPSPWKPANHWGTVQALVASRSNVFAGGEFHFADDRPATNIACWDGREWKPLGSGVNDYGYVRALAVRGAVLYAGGNFRQVGDVQANQIARWDGQAWFPLGSGIERYAVTALAVRGDSLFVGGSFDRAGGKPSTNIARWHWPRTLNVTRRNGLIELNWPGVETNAVLETTSNPTGDWHPVSTEPRIEDGRLSVTQPLESTQRYFRLRYP